MNTCKACNTPVARHARSCPGCGRSLAPNLGAGGAHDPGMASARPLVPEGSSAFMDDAEELPLQEEVGEESAAGSAAPPPEATAYRASRKGAPSSAAPARRAPGRAGAPAALSVKEVRGMVLEHPELLERGLSLGSEGTGRDVATEVGPIDLVARDADGAWVVVTVPGPEAGSDLVGEVLRRMGWVRKHRARAGQEVRAIVVLERVPEDLVYAAAAVSDTVVFRTWRVSVQFDDVAL